MESANIEPATLYKLVLAVGLTSAVLASSITALFQLINGWRERRSADRRHFRELALKAAIVQWEFQLEKTKAYNASLQRQEPPKLLSEVDFDMILIKKLKLIETFAKRNISASEIERGIREMGEIAEAIRRGLPRKKNPVEEKGEGKN